ncbi:TonB-dependent siderophore receptor [Duganella sp. CY15W]|uniref:TonB-dependent siderophore receptor n=1 Tax=Duganella sp. CY15W TaxID=2692172 RepID=UPI001369266E|nr:TonB-dependent siderophore receptor [Duganella sp. CY15W]MYM27721.1 TonB-dependent siderophore receptor [Duganella sp. CY15W]
MSPREIPSTAFQAGLAGLLFTLTLTSAARAADLAPSSAILPQVLVTAEQEKATGAVMGYAASRSATATKTDTAIAETPQSITVIGAEQIETLKAQNLTDAIAYAIGGARAPYVERIGDEVMLRGFMIPTSFRDGTRYQSNRFDGQQEPYGLERVEVLKGASSILYGAAEPGGVVNTVSKRPTTEALREINVELGSFKRKQVAADFAGALSQDGTWSYRLTGLKRDSDTAIDFIPDNRAYIAPALTWQPSASTSLTLLSEYQRDRTAYSGDGLPAAGTVAPNVNGPIPRRRFTGEPGYDHYHIDRFSLGYLFEHAFNDQLKLHHSLRRYNMRQDWAAISVPFNLSEDQRSVEERYGEDRKEHSSGITSDTSLQYDWQSAGIAHKSLIGIDYAEQKWATLRYDRAVGPLDLYTPVYGGPIGEPQQSTATRTTTRQLGLYFQDQMKIASKWVLLLGGRQDKVRQKQCNYFDQSQCTVDNERSSAFTSRVGAVYLAGNGLAPFASFSQSFAPLAGIDRSGSRFKPTRGEQYEAGIRYQPRGSALMLSAATYQLTQTNVLTDDPADPRYQMQQGEVRSRGVELEAKGRIGRNAQIIAAYTYTDVRTTKAGPLYPEQAGLRVSGIPYNQLSVWGDASLAAFGLPQIKLGAGARYVGETSSQWHDYRGGDYTVFDAMASYTAGPWRFALNLSNVSDKTFITACPYRCFYGEPRKAIASAVYRW